jgi:hypothetical protein
MVFCLNNLFLSNYPLLCPQIAANGMAAWRSGGIYALPFKSALPAAVAPNRSLAAGHFPRVLSL